VKAVPGLAFSLSFLLSLKYSGWILLSNRAVVDFFFTKYFLNRSVSPLSPAQVIILLLSTATRVNPDKDPVTINFISTFWGAHYPSCLRWEFAHGLDDGYPPCPYFSRLAPGPQVPWLYNTGNSLLLASSLPFFSSVSKVNGGGWPHPNTP